LLKPCWVPGYRRFHEVLARLGLVELREHLARLVLVAGIAAEREERIGCEGHEALEGDATRDVLDVGIEPAVLVDHEHCRQLPRSLGGPDEIAPHAARPRRRGVLYVLGLKPRVVLRNLLGLREAGVQGVEQHHGGETAHGVLGRPVEEAAAIEGAVDVGVETVVHEAADLETVDRVIFAELVDGVFTDESRQAYYRVIARLGERGCEAVALACTEIPLLVRADESPLPTLDSTRLLARAAVVEALR
jgi:hypothetical protein